MSQSVLTICIVHYNTPFLTECLVKSVNKFTPNCRILIFDNSDKQPFTYRQDNIVYIDNTKGQIINFDEWLKKFPERTRSYAKHNNYASAKHSYSIQKCIEIINENFILLDSDILLKGDISSLVENDYAFVGDSMSWKPKLPASSVRKMPQKRVLPYICYLNVEMLKENGISFHNDNLMHGLTIHGDYYDTGAYLFQAVSEKGLKYKEIDYTQYVVHYKGASWLNSAREFDNYKKEEPKIWVNKYKNYWEDER